MTRELASVDLDKSEELVLDKTSPMVIMRANEPLFLGAYVEPVAALIKKSLLIDTNDSAEKHHWVPAYSDLYRRGIIDYQQDFVDDSGYNDVLFERLNELEASANDVERSESSAGRLAFLAFSGVLMRPKDLVLRDYERKLHKTDVGSARGEHRLAEVYRHRRNLLFNLASDTDIKERDHRHLRPFINNGRLVINDEIILDKLPELDPAKDRKTVDIIQRLYIANYASKLLKLFRTDNETAETLRFRFIERGFDILNSLEAEHMLGKDLFYADITDQQIKHILQGDKHGGGHHIPSLNPEYKRLVGEVVELPSSLDSNVMVPVAMSARVINGVQQKPELHYFFPSDWSAEEVIGAVKQPGRLVFERERKGKIEQYCHTKGIVIKRIIGLYEDCDAEEVVTAFPEVDVPADLRNKLVA